MSPREILLTPRGLNDFAFNSKVHMRIGILLNYADDSSSSIATPASDRLFAEAKDFQSVQPNARIQMRRHAFV